MREGVEVGGGVFDRAFSSARLNVFVVGDVAWRCSKVEVFFAVCICSVQVSQQTRNTE